MGSPREKAQPDSATGSCSASETVSSTVSASQDPTALPLEERADAVNLTRCPSLILLARTPKGRGIFATAPIRSGVVVDVSPVLVLDYEENKAYVSKSRLYFYTYNWPQPPLASGHQPGTQALPLGLGSMFNHANSSSRRHNIGFVRDIEKEIITYTTLRDIAKGEELCICYGDSRRLGFLDTDSEEKEENDWENEMEPDGIDGMARISDDLWSG